MSCFHSLLFFSRRYLPIIIFITWRSHAFTFIFPKVFSFITFNPWKNRVWVHLCLSRSLFLLQPLFPGRVASDFTSSRRSFHLSPRSFLHRMETSYSTPSPFRSRSEDCILSSIPRKRLNRSCTIERSLSSGLIFFFFFTLNLFSGQEALNLRRYFYGAFFFFSL